MSETREQLVRDNLERLARTNYEAYCEAVGGVSAISGDRLPTWDEQCSDPGRAAVVRAWRHAAVAVAQLTVELA